MVSSISKIIVIFLMINFGNSSDTVQVNLEEVNSDFNDYWYAGEAELNRFELKQARYGEVHEGEAVLIFVTEDFLEDKQVKYEFGDKSNAVPVLKLNSTKKFFTGIYPYSMMSSVFTPIDLEDQTLKVSTSSQEWCGHSFTQLNRHNNNYKVSQYSYFQSEADESFSIEKAVLEDELWGMLRISPRSLPLGNTKMIPSTMNSRLNHKKLKAERAKTSLRENNGESTYSIDYAKRTKQMKLDYWNRNGVGDGKLRKQLGLSGF